MGKAALLAAELAAYVFLCACSRPAGCGPKALSSVPHRRAGARVEYYLNREANDLTETAVTETFSRWEKFTHFQFVYKGRWRAGLQRDGKNTVSFLVRWPEDIPIAKVAYCRNWYNRRGEIVESDIILNMTMAQFTTLHTNKPGSYYIEGVLSHEIGHMIGLEHVEDESSLMKNLSSSQESYFKGAIDELTLEQYRRLYPEQAPPQRCRTGG